MTRMKKTTALSIVFIVALVGCQTNPKFESYDNTVQDMMEEESTNPVCVYLLDRFLDLTDIVQLNLAIGDGGLFNLHITKAFQLGFGKRDGVCFGFMPRSFGMWHEDRQEGGLRISPYMVYYKKCDREALWGTTTLFDHDCSFEGADHKNNCVTDASAIGLSTQGYLGVDVNVSPFQVADFIFGFFGMPFIIPVDPIGFGTEIDVPNDDFRARKARNSSDLPYYDDPDIAPYYKKKEGLSD